MNSTRERHLPETGGSSRTRARLRRWVAIVRERVLGETPKAAERAVTERGEHSGAGFSYKARDGL
jgi:hypothetical protein